MSKLTGDNDLIIGACSNYGWEHVKLWVNSINQSGFTGRKVLLIIEPDHQNDRVQRLVYHAQEAGVQCLHGLPNQGVAPHVDRFQYIKGTLGDFYNDTFGEKTPKPEYVITTDVRDVVFQSNPSTWLRVHGHWQNTPRLVVASESLKYKDEPWGKQNFTECFGPHWFERYKENTIYNVGTFAGTYEEVKDMCEMIYLMSINRPIPIVDQAVFNMMLYMSPYKGITQYDAAQDGWCVTLGTQMDPSKIEAFRPHLLDPEPEFDEEGVVYTGNGLRPCIVHQYDRVPELKKKIEARYGA